jgi:N-acetylmuramoyl-L-alanine amidase
VKLVDKPSANQNRRPAGVKASVIVIHGTAGQTDRGDVSWCCDPESKVSYHFIIGRDGTVYRLVRDTERAWHAGKSLWGKPNCNDFSIGLGFSNDGKEPYTEAQYVAGKELVDELRAKYDIGPENIVGHCHISPDRKTDPWLHFQWGRLFD